jgi:Protein of unknown function (DUF3017)
VTPPTYPEPEPQEPRYQPPYPVPPYPGGEQPRPADQGPYEYQPYFQPRPRHPEPAHPRQQRPPPHQPPPYQPEPYQPEPYQPEPYQPPHEPLRVAGVRAKNLHNLPAVLVLLLAGGGILYAGIVPNHWLRGVLFMAGALGLGGVFRLVLPARQAGWLAVRGRMVDVFCYLATGTALWVVGLLLPPGRT